MKKAAVITGATSGIGYEMARILAKENTDLVIAGRNAGKLSEMQEDFSRTYKIRVIPVVADLAQPAAARYISDQIAASGLEIHYLINNAGFGDYGLFQSSDLTNMTEMISVNITSLTQLTRLLLPQMIRRKSGRVMNVSSTAAFEPGPRMAVYYATKAYVLSFSEAISHELKDQGITVTAFCPGPTKSKFQERSGQQKSWLINHWKLAKAEDVAAYGIRQMEKGKTVAVPGFLNWLGTKIVQFVPRKIVTSVVARLQAPAHES